MSKNTKTVIMLIVGCAGLGLGVDLHSATLGALGCGLMVTGLIKYLDGV